MKVAVTGSTGFLGRHLVRHLLDHGRSVRAVHRGSSPAGQRQPSGVELVRADVLDRISLVRALRGAEVVVHAAGHVGSGAAAWKVNALAPRIVVEAAAEAGAARVVHVSSVVAVGPVAPGRLGRESDLYRGGCLGLDYVDSKHQGEVEATAAALRLGVDLVVANPAYMVGVPIDRDVAAASSARTLVAFAQGAMAVVVDGLTNVVDVRDVARGVRLVAERGHSGERYILGGTNIAWTAVADRLARRAPARPGEPVLVLPPELARLAHAQQLLGLPPVATGGLLTRLAAPSWQYSSDKAERELGYVSRPLDITLDAVIEWSASLLDAGIRFGDRPGLARRAVGRALAVPGAAGLLGRAERRLGRRLVVRR